MTILRERPGLDMLMRALASERVLPKTGVVLVPYQAEWGAPDTMVRMTGYDERINETFGEIDTIELSAEGGATIIGYRMTDGNAVAASHTFADAGKLVALYPGKKGEEIKISVGASIAEVGKKELIVKGPIKTEKFSFADKDELVNKTQLSLFVRYEKGGASDIPNTSESALTGGVTGIGTLTSTDFTKLFSAIGGADFDTLYLPSDDLAIIAAAKQFMADRRKLNKKMSTLVIGGKASEDLNMAKHNERSVAQNARYVVNSAISGEHNNGKKYNSLQWAAWTAGMLAATPAHISLTAQVVPLKKADKDWSHTEILSALSSGTLIATRDGDVYIIESAVNTLSTIGPDEREDYGKIRVSMTLDQIYNDIKSPANKYKGKLSNNDIGGAVFVGAVGTYLAIREQQGAIETGWSFTDKKNGSGDRRGFKLVAKPLDAIEYFDVEWEVA